MAGIIYVINLTRKLKQRYEVTDNAIETIKEWRSPPGEKIFQSKLRFQIRSVDTLLFFVDIIVVNACARLDDFRKRIVANENISSIDLR